MDATQAGTTHFVIIPGWAGSGPEHWQSWIEAELRAVGRSTVSRVEFSDWMHPDHQWVEQIRCHVNALGVGADTQVILVAHSAGAVACAHYAAEPDSCVAGVVLVAPADTEAPDALEDIRDLELPRRRLAVESWVVCSSTDPHCGVERSREFAQMWGSVLVEVGDRGHLNEGSGHGVWPEGVGIVRAAASVMCPQGREIETPFLQVDADVVGRQIEWMHRHPVRIRPHVKTHKCAQIARMQIRAGASGVTVATVGEAEAFVEALGSEIPSIFIAYPLWIDGRKGSRLGRVARQVPTTVGACAVEHIDNVVAAGLADCVDVMIELDCGMHRSGVAPEQVVGLFRHAQEVGVRVSGIFTFPGHSYVPGGVGDAAGQEAESIARAVELIEEEFPGSGAGLCRSGGSSPTANRDDFYSEGFDEIRPGAYVFNDAQQWELGVCDRGEIGLWAQATVVAYGNDGRGGRTLVLDSGTKVLGADRAGWASGNGRLLDFPDARIVSASEHHAVVVGAPKLPLGCQVRVVPNHCCNAVNLADSLWTTAGQEWKVIARGRNC